MNTNSKKAEQAIAENRIASTTSQNLLKLLQERKIPKERGAVLEVIAKNFDLIAGSGNEKIVDTIIKRTPEAPSLIKAMGLKRMSKLWESGTGKDVKDIAFNLIQGKVFDLNR